MTKRFISRPTVRFLAARRLTGGVDVTATFEAAKTSGEIGHYKVQLTIDPISRVVRSPHFVLRNKSGGGFVLQNTKGKDAQWDLAREVGDMFLKTPAWTLLRDREPDSKFVVDREGRRIERGRKSGGEN